MKIRRNRRVRSALVALVAACSLLAASCGGGESAPTQVSSAPAAEASLVATTVDGGQVDFGALEGQDVVLWFWAPW